MIMLAYCSQGQVPLPSGTMILNTPITTVLAPDMLKSRRKYSPLLHPSHMAINPAVLDLSRPMVLYTYSDYTMIADRHKSLNSAAEWQVHAKVRS